jgi:outer membrane protein assembly factor BamB
MKLNLTSKIKPITKTISVCLLVGFTSFLTGCGSKDNTLPPTPLTKYTPKIDIQKKWSNSIRPGSSSNAYIIGTAHTKNRLIAANINGKLKAINPISGDTLWSKSTKFKFSATPLLENKTIYIGTYNGYLTAFDAVNGTFKWKANIGSTILAQPSYSDNKVFVHSNNDFLTAVDATNGKVLWAYRDQIPTIVLQADSKPIISSDGNVIFGNDNGLLNTISADKGEKVWSYPVAVPTGANAVSRMVDITSTPLLDGDTIYVMPYSGKTKAIDLTSNQQMWQRDYQGYRDMAQDDLHIYLVTNKSKVVSLNKMTGRTYWVQKKLMGRMVSAPAILNGKYLVVGDFAGYVHFMDTETGELLGRTKITGSAINAAPAIYNNSAIVNTVNGKIAALSASKASLK